MAAAQKQQVRLVFKLIAFGGFIMLSYLGIRSYRNAVEMTKINACIEQIGDISRNVQEKYMNARNYDGLDYKRAVSLNIFPKNMFKEGFKEAVNSYNGGVDLFYSGLGEDSPAGAFEVSFQGISDMACAHLIRMNWDGGAQENLIAVAGYASAMPSGVLDEIYPGTEQNTIKKRNIFKGNVARFADDYTVEDICRCSGYTCTVVWKFR